MADLIVLGVEDLEINEIAIKNEFIKGGNGFDAFVELVKNLVAEEMPAIELTEAHDLEEGFKMRRKLSTKINKAYQSVDKIGQDAYQEAQDIPKTISQTRIALRKAISEGEDSIRGLILAPINERKEREDRLTALVDLKNARIDELVNGSLHMSVEQINSAVSEIDGITLEFFSEEQEVKFNGKRFIAIKNLNEMIDVKKAELEEKKKAEAEYLKQLEEEAKKRAEAEAKEREARLIAEKEKAEAEAEKQRLQAIEDAKKAEQSRIEAEKQAQERLEQQKIQAEKDRIEAERVAEEKIEFQKRQAQKAKEEAELRAQQQIEHAKRQAELKAQQQKEREEQAQRAREADVENRKLKNREALADIINLGLSEDDARLVVTAIARNEVRNVKINY